MNQKFYVSLSGDLLDEVAERARADQLPMATVIRLLCWRGLRRQPETPLLEDLPSSDPVALAALVCTEQVLQTLLAVLPEARQREAELRAAAAAAAEERLRRIREAGR